MCWELGCATRSPGGCSARTSRGEGAGWRPGASRSAVTADALLAVKDLRVEFPTRQGTLVAVDRVSFSVAAGEVLGVVGESGAGKSLTGAAVIGLIDPPRRSRARGIWLNGLRRDKLPPQPLPPS